MKYTLVGIGIGHIILSVTLCGSEASEIFILIIVLAGKLGVRLVSSKLFHVLWFCC